VACDYLSRAIWSSVPALRLAGPKILVFLDVPSPIRWQSQHTQGYREPKS